MRVLVLVIASDNNPVYTRFREQWTRYMSMDPDIQCQFLESAGIIARPIQVAGRRIRVQGEETYPNILPKTLAAFQWALGQPWDFLVRTNLSSVYVWPRLKAALETAPRSGLYMGPVLRHLPFLFVSGCNFTISRDVCALAVQNSRAILRGLRIMDDADLGRFWTGRGIVPIEVPMVYGKHGDDGKAYHYRCREDFGPSRRDAEPDVMRALVDHFYFPASREASS